MKLVQYVSNVNHHQMWKCLNQWNLEKIQSSKINSMIHWCLVFIQIGVANGPPKTKGLAKFSLNFMGLAVAFFSSYVCLTVSIFLTKLSRSLDFFKAKKVVKSWFAYFFFIKLSDITTSQNLNVLSSQLKHFKVSVSQLKKSKCHGLAKKMLILSSRKVSHLPFTTPNADWR